MLDPNAGFFAMSNSDDGQRQLNEFLELATGGMPDPKQRIRLVNKVGELMREVYRLGFDAGVIEQLTTVREEKRT